LVLSIDNIATENTEILLSNVKNLNLNTELDSWLNIQQTEKLDINVSQNQTLRIENKNTPININAKNPVEITLLAKTDLELGNNFCKLGKNVTLSEKSIILFDDIGRKKWTNICPLQ